jgi:8-oxo-dGTP diphosphatase
MPDDQPLPDRYTRVGAYVLCRDAVGRVLMCRIADGSSGDGSWTIPGGGVEFGEDPAEAAVRELEEETGLVGELGALLGISSHVYGAAETASGREVHMIGIVYEARAHDGELRHEIGGSTDMAAWIAPSDAERLPLAALASFALRLVRSRDAEVASRSR